VASRRGSAVLASEGSRESHQQIHQRRGRTAVELIQPIQLLSIYKGSDTSLPFYFLKAELNLPAGVCLGERLFGL